MPKLTDRQCMLTKSEIGKDVKLSDGGGLYLRIRSGATLTSKTWLFRFKRLDGLGSRWFEIGSYPDKTLAQARKEAAELTLKRRAGIDPIEEKIAAEEVARRVTELAKAAEAARITVGQLFQRWAETDLIRHKDGGQHVKDTMHRHVLPHLGEMLVEDVRKGHVTAVTDKLLAAGKQRTAKVCLSLLRQMLRFAVDRDVIEFDPTSSLRKAAIGGKDTERDRVLSTDEIKVLATNLPQAGLRESTGTAIWLVLATGWPAAWVCDELGIRCNDAPQIEKIFVDFLLSQGLPVCPETMQTGRALLSHETKGGDPAFMAWESALIAEILNAWATRCIDTLSAMNEKESASS